SKQIALEIVPIGNDDFPHYPSPEEQRSILEEIMSQELDVLVGWTFPEQMAYPLLDAGLPIVHFGESDINHPLSVCPRGLKAVACEMAEFVARKLNYQGQVVAIGGLRQGNFADDGRTRVIGVQEVFRNYPDVRLTHIPTNWDHERASTQIRAGLE